MNINKFNNALTFVFQFKEPCLSTEHSHAGSDVAVEVVKTRNAMKDHAVVSKERPGQIFASHVAGTSDGVKATLPKKDSEAGAEIHSERQCSSGSQVLEGFYSGG